MSVSVSVSVLARVGESASVHYAHVGAVASGEPSAVVHVHVHVHVHVAAAAASSLDRVHAGAFVSAADFSSSVVPPLAAVGVGCNFLYYCTPLNSFQPVLVTALL